MKHLYSPAKFKGLSFAEAREAFLRGADTPTAYLERCLRTIEERDASVKAWVTLNVPGARRAAAESTQRYRARQPRSMIDGMPVGIKDLIDTHDMPTQMGCAAYAGYRPKCDAPVVRALRDAGAIILGKTVTAELGMNQPGPTTNPFDSRRTPGGSSSGSAAAVGACMVPAAIGTQVGGSIIRPSSYCANYALKPTLGALNRGSALGLSQEVYGVHAASLEDMWQVVMEIASRVGGDPGYPGLYGLSMPEAHKPRRLAILETSAWGRLDLGSASAFEKVIHQLRRHGVEILERKNCGQVEAFECCMAEAKAITDDINSYELRVIVHELRQSSPGMLSQRLVTRMEKANTITQGRYRELLQRREQARQRFARLVPTADALITLSSLGPAPEWEGDLDPRSVNPTPTGDSSFNVAASLLGAPAITVPMLAVDDLPLGVQIIGQPHEDERLCSFARWIKGTLDYVAVP